jgi:hypothetical protein
LRAQTQHLPLPSQRRFTIPFPRPSPAPQTGPTSASLCPTDRRPGTPSSHSLYSTAWKHQIGAPTSNHSPGSGLSSLDLGIHSGGARQRVVVPRRGGRIHHAEQMRSATKPRPSQTRRRRRPRLSTSASGRRGWLRLRPVLLLLVPHVQATTLASNGSCCTGDLPCETERLRGRTCRRVVTTATFLRAPTTSAVRATQQRPSCRTTQGRCLS